MQHAYCLATIMSLLGMCYMVGICVPKIYISGFLLIKPWLLACIVASCEYSIATLYSCVKQTWITQLAGCSAMMTI